MMTEENKPEEKKPETKQEEKLSFLKEVKKEREELEKVRAGAQEDISRLQELKAVEVLSGKTEAGKPEEKKEETPKEYKDRIMAGG